MTPEVSVVMPTYNEAKNIAELIGRVDASFKETGVPVEMIVVDDNSPDGTAKIAEGLKGQYNLKVICRTGERGLATAVVRGWQASEGRYLAVIDSDLQHPPDIIRRLYESAKEGDADMAIASRRVEGGGTKDWEWHRVVISVVANLIAKFCLPKTLWNVRDTTTGCFLFRRECVDLPRLSPHGFKIFLEVLVRGKFNKRIEVPYVFNQRVEGTSKMSVKQDVIFILHLMKLGAATGEVIIPLGAGVLLGLLLIRVI